MILGKTDECLTLNPIEKKLAGFDFELFNIDGHKTEEIVSCLEIKSSKPKIILANTIKGKGFSVMENKASWHYWQHLTSEQVTQCREDIK